MQRSVCCAACRLAFVECDNSPAEAGTAATERVAAGMASSALLSARACRGPLQVLEWCKKQAIDLVVIGPEAPLVAGLSDDLRAGGMR